MRVELQGVRKSHMLPNGGFLTLLAGVDLTLESGAAVMIQAASGSGKTTLLDIIAGLTRPSSGAVLLDGTPVRRGSLRGGAIGQVFQNPVFIPELTVTENLLLPLLRCREHTAAVQTERLLERFGLAERFDLLPAALSAGERQRLNLARALVSAPRLLLLDEPCTGLDDAWQEQIMELIMRQVRDTRATLVIAATGQVVGTAGFRQLRLHKGKVIIDGTSDY